MRNDDLRRRQKQAPRTLNVAADVGLDEVHVATDFGDGLVKRHVPNRSDELELLCDWLRLTAHYHGFSLVQLVVEPTGIYHELLVSIARQRGLAPRFVKGEAVKKNQVVMFGDYGKTDHRDPEVILDLADRNVLIADRQLPETFRALRNAGIIYARAERDAVRAKNRIHRARRRVFPDFPLSKKGRALARHVLSQIVVPLVRGGRLLADFHRHKTKVEKKPGPVAMAAAARKVLNILVGWGRSGRSFDPARVFTCESQLPKAA